MEINIFKVSPNHLKNSLWFVNKMAIIYMALSLSLLNYQNWHLIDKESISQTFVGWKSACHLFHYVNKKKYR